MCDPIVPTTTTLYIEEVTSDNEDDGTLDTLSPTMSPNDDVVKTVTKTTATNKTAAENSSRKLSFTYNIKKRLDYPKKPPIGGGASLTAANGRLYSFGGCRCPDGGADEVTPATTTRDNNLPLRCFDADSFHEIDIPNNDDDTTFPTNDRTAAAARALRDRFNHTCVQHGNDLYVFGGQSITRDSQRQQRTWNDIHRFDTTRRQWSDISPETTTAAVVVAPRGERKQPSARHSHAAVSMTDGKMIIFGGADERGAALNDVWTFCYRSRTWREITTFGEKEAAVPEGREMHCAVVLEREMYVMGGRGRDGVVLNELWCLDTEKWLWRKEPSSPSPVCSHFTGLLRLPPSSRPCIVTVGGWNGETVTNDICIYDVLSRTWRMLPSCDAAVQHLEVRFAHAGCVIDDDVLCILGGVTIGRDLGDVCVISVVGKEN